MHFRGDSFTEAISTKKHPSKYVQVAPKFVCELYYPFLRVLTFTVIEPRELINQHSNISYRTEIWIEGGAPVEYSELDRYSLNYLANNARKRIFALYLDVVPNT